MRNTNVSETENTKFHPICINASGFLSSCLETSASSNSTLI